MRTRVVLRLLAQPFRLHPRLRRGRRGRPPPLAVAPPPLVVAAPPLIVGPGYGWGGPYVGGYWGGGYGWRRW